MERQQQYNLSPSSSTHPFIFVALLEKYYPCSFRYFETSDPKPPMNFLTVMFESISIGRLSVTLLFEPCSCFDDSLVNLLCFLG